MLTIYALGHRVSEGVALSMVVAGVATMYGWRLFGPAAVYAVVPAIAAGLAVFVFASLALRSIGSGRQPLGSEGE